MKVKKVAVVTGAANGIGKAIAKRLAEDGFDIIVSDINIEAADETVKEFTEQGYTAYAVETDVSKQSDHDDLIERAIEEFGRIDVFVNNAGIVQIQPLSEVDEAALQSIYGINVFGTLYGMQAAAKVMKEQEFGGKIINACSIAGYTAPALLGIYSSTKFAVRSLTQSAAREWAKDKRWYYC